KSYGCSRHRGAGGIPNGPAQFGLEGGLCLTHSRYQEQGYQRQAGRMIQEGSDTSFHVSFLLGDLDSPGQGSKLRLPPIREGNMIDYIHRLRQTSKGFFWVRPQGWVRSRTKQLL